MERHDTDGTPGGAEQDAPRRPANHTWLLLIVLTAIAVLFVINSTGSVSKVTYSFLLEQLAKDNIVRLDIGIDEIEGVFKEPPEIPVAIDDTGKAVTATDKNKGGRRKYLQKFVTTRPYDSENISAELRAAAKEGVLIDHNRRDFGDFLLVTMLLALPVVFILIMWMNYRRSRDQFMGGGGFLSGFSRSPAKKYEGEQQGCTFDDVAGLESVKADLAEIVEFLKFPAKFKKLGGRVPKGVLLNGPPGTGKTLLARAVAGEAGVPFYSVSGSEFIQMFVGVGASRVRDLFKTAKESGAAIIFIDEIDAVGRQRGAGLGGGHDEREQTLNQILSEMDGFTQTDSVIVLAATNRPDVLDPALLRPGRFDRHVTVGRPTQKGRLAIFKVHVRDVPLADDVDLEVLASGTIGLTGADIRNVVNEAALWAARGDKRAVDMSDFDYARDKTLMGARREEVLNEDEKRSTAYHEAGHTLCAWVLKGAHRVHKVTIVPRGRSLGSTQTLPSEDKLSMSHSELCDQLIVFLGGRAAETIIYNETSVGAENDLERATGLARRMVTHWGMSERLGPVSYKSSSDDPFLGREIHQQRQFSEHTMEVIDQEVTKILHSASTRAIELLTEHRGKLEKITQGLLECEELDEREITALIGPSVHPGKLSGKLHKDKPPVDKSSADKNGPEKLVTDKLVTDKLVADRAATSDALNASAMPSDSLNKTASDSAGLADSPASESASGGGAESAEG
jgi:cell division protease FtsH